MGALPISMRKVTRVRQLQPGLGAAVSEAAAAASAAAARLENAVLQKLQQSAIDCSVKPRKLRADAVPPGSEGEGEVEGLDEVRQDVQRARRVRPRTRDQLRVVRDDSRVDAFPQALNHQIVVAAYVRAKDCRTR